MTMPSHGPRGSRPRRTSPLFRLVAGSLFLLVGPLASWPLHAQDAGAPRDAGALTDAALRSAAIAAGYVAQDASLEDDGRILASATEGSLAERSLTVFDVIHVDAVFDGRAAAVGDTLLVYRRGRDLESPASHEQLGRVVYPTGLAVVTATARDVASAEIVSAFHPVQTGQRVQYLKARPGPVPVGERAPGVGLVVGVRDRSAVQAPFAIIYLDLPPGSDLRVGQEVALVRPAAEDGRELPEIELGSARVLDVGEAAATATVTALARSDLGVGDRYRALEPPR